MTASWLGFELTTPIVLASLTPISHARIREHVDFIKSAFKYGAGAVVLGSVNPCYIGNPNYNYTHNDLLCIKSGLYDTFESMMAISLIGPPYPNLSSVEYGVNLVKNLRKEIKNDIIVGSVINMGGISDVVMTATQLVESGVNAIELNLSCPNVNTDTMAVATGVEEVIKEIYDKTKVPISLKFSPTMNYSYLLDNNVVMKIISAITVNNAYFDPESIIRTNRMSSI